MADCIDQQMNGYSTQLSCTPDINDKQVIGPDGQVCASQTVLDQILQVYTHISANLFHRGTNGKISGECMMCECRYEPGKSF